MFRRLLPVTVLLSMLLALPADASATFAGPAGRILFDRYTGTGRTHPILTMLPNGRSQQQVYSWTSARRVFDTEFSANGRFLIFGQSTDTTTSLQRMSASGTGRVVLQSGASTSASPSVPAAGHWSPSGEVWYERTFGFTNTDLFAPGGRFVTRVFSTSADAGGTGPTGWAFSPDGSQVVYEKVVRTLEGEFIRTDRDLWIIDADGTDDRRLTSFGDLLDRSEGESSVAWSSNGFVYFTRIRRGTADFLLQRIRTDGSQLGTITANPKDYAVAPNGRAIAYVTSSGALVVAAPDGSGRRVLARDVGALVFSPDSRRIAFSQSMFGGATDVVSIRIDGIGRVNLTNTGRWSESPLDWARVPPR